DTLQDKIAQNIKECFDQIHCKDGVTYIINKDNKGYKLENNEWKEFEIQKDKPLNQDIIKKIDENIEVKSNKKSLEELIREFTEYKEKNQQLEKDKNIDFGR
ncbi:MAG: hypothetical protein LBF13_01825, partial [Campylobacteraceae bacterium]|nr:hypothetical protein [Campylobacteraceae bacterium]